MIDSISLTGVATFGTAPEVLQGLSRFNYIYGANGSGKTTLSRVIAEESSFPSCAVSWRGGTKLEALVYNRDFVDKNFDQSSELRGVFTLGEKQLDTLAKIATAKLELDALTTRIETLTHSLDGMNGVGGKRAELAKLETAFNEKCWAKKLKHEATLKDAFHGHMGSKEAFKNKVLSEQSSQAALSTLAALEKKANSVFGGTPTPEAEVLAVDASPLLAHETTPILKKKVIGKSDVDIAAMIKKLGNSDWVRQGREYFDANNGRCPFCQQDTDAQFEKSLEEYFDESYLKDTEAIDQLVTKYASDASLIQARVDRIIATPSRFLDVEALKTEKKVLDSTILLNTQLLAGKQKESSQVVTLQPLSSVCTAIKKLIDSANVEVAAHNLMVENLAAERSALCSLVWRFVVEELKLDLATYKTEKDGLDKAIAAIKKQLEAKQEEKRIKFAELRQLEKATTSIQPTIEGINGILASFDFYGFKLAKAATGTAYKLVREDGSDAKQTLSEGEKTFVTFLYFYHLLKGSESESGMTTNRVIVFDDPVSSLDSDILFIVGTLVKSLFDEVRNGEGYIRQVFVLTHNVYFHKEVTYSSRRVKNAGMNEETFWVVRKIGGKSRVQRHQSNPIKTSYELLWSQVRKREGSNISLQNTLRRILENYFKILGGVDFDELCNFFNGSDKLLCRSLCSWVHDGSHYAHDDAFVSIDDAMIDGYMKVFRAIFTKSGHPGHYRMMMGEDFVEEPVAPPPNGVSMSTSALLPTPSAAVPSVTTTG